jgi:hypothetical protein
MKLAQGEGNPNATFRAILACGVSACYTCLHRERGHLQGTTNTFPATFDPEGNPVWSKGLGDGLNSTKAIADDAGNILFAGNLYSMADFGGGRLVVSGSRRRVRGKGPAV